MRITEPDVIRAGEKDLIDAVKADLDWSAVREIVKKNLSKAALESRGGEIIVHNNQIAFRIDVALKLNVSLMFGRDGTYIPETVAEAGAEELDALSLSDLSLDNGLPETQTTSQDWGTDTAGTFMDLDMETETSEPGDLGMDLTLEQGPDLEEDGIDLDEGELLLDDNMDLNAGPDTESTREPDLDLDELSLLDDEIDGAEGKNMDSEIDDILKESRAFWDQKKDEP